MSVSGRVVLGIYLKISEGFIPELTGEIPDV